MTGGTRRINFLDYLPEVFVTGGQAPGEPAAQQAASFLARFLAAFEELHEQLLREIEGDAGGTGGIPDLFDPNLTPPPQFARHGGDDIDWLRYLAGWVGLRLRPEKTVTWNRRFLRRAIELAAWRGTLAGLDALLRAWLADDLAEGDLPPVVLTDLAPTRNLVDTAFQLDESAVLGVQTVLGEGPPCFFVVDLVAAPGERALHNPIGLDLLQRAARSLLNAEKPAHTYYELRVRARTMQLAPADPADARPGEIYAQLEHDGPDDPVLGTTMLWDEPWVFAAEVTTPS